MFPISLHYNLTFSRVSTEKAAECICGFLAYSQIPADIPRIFQHPQLAHPRGPHSGLDALAGGTGTTRPRPHDE